MVKCRLCNKKAIVRLRYARRDLCKDHFIEFIERRFEKIIVERKLLRGIRKVIVAVSGGKDSITLLHMLHRISKKLGFEIYGLTIDLGIDLNSSYSKKSVEAAVKNFEMLNINYKVVNIKKKYGFTIDDVARYGRKAGIRKPVCSICGTVKRYVMNKFATEIKADAIATGHNLDDTLHYVFSSIYSGRWEDLKKYALVTPSKYKLISRIKPLAYISEKETLLYVLLKETPFNHEVCPHTVTRRFHMRIRKMINEFEEEYPGSKITLARTFLEKIQPALSTYYPEEEKEIRECEICNMPTTGKVCAFCKIRLAMEKVLKYGES